MDDERDPLRADAGGSEHLANAGGDALFRRLGRRQNLSRCLPLGAFENNIRECAADIDREPAILHAFPPRALRPALPCIWPFDAFRVQRISAACGTVDSGTVDSNCR